MEKIDISDKAEDFFKFQLHRNITNLYKSFLINLEELSEPPYNLSEDKRMKIRKQVLDKGNDTIRELESYCEKFKFTFK